VLALKINPCAIQIKQSLLMGLQVGFVPSLNKAQAVVTGSHNI